MKDTLLVGLLAPYNFHEDSKINSILSISSGFCDRQVNMYRRTRATFPQTGCGSSIIYKPTWPNGNS